MLIGLGLGHKPHPRPGCSTWGDMWTGGQGHGGKRGHLFPEEGWMENAEGTPNTIFMRM